MTYALALVLVTTVAISGFLLAVHIGFRAPRRVERGTPGDLGLEYREISIRIAESKRLFAWWLPVASDVPTIIVLHGWGGNAEMMLPVAIPLHSAGLNVLLLDARNHGRSDTASFSSLPRFAEDARAAIDWVTTHCGAPQPKIALLGHSVGAGAVLLEASRRHDITAVISVSAFAHPEWMMRRYLDRIWIPGILASWILCYVEWIIGYHYEEIAPMNTACRVKCPILLVHGKADRRVPVSDALAIRNNCGNESIELLLIEDADHESVDKVEDHGHQLTMFLKRAGIIGQASTGCGNG